MMCGGGNGGGNGGGGVFSVRVHSQTRAEALTPPPRLFSHKKEKSNNTRSNKKRREQLTRMLLGDTGESKLGGCG
jgi:hypothetical protein